MKRASISLVLLASTIGVAMAGDSPSFAKQESDHAAVARARAGVNRPVRDKWALVVGISDFADSSHNLQYPAKDARDFADYLVKEAHFARDHVKILLNSEATEKRILSEIGNKWLPHVANPDDLVVLYFSTHGSGAELDVGGQNYLVAYDTDVNDLYTSGISMNRLAQDIRERIHCDRVVIFLDACHSGATNVGAKGLSRTGIDADEFAVGSGQMVITSSTEAQRSWESKSRANSVFTGALLDALRSSDGTSLGSMFDVLKDKVQSTVLRERGVLQTPVLKSAWEGQELVLSVPPANPQPGLEEDNLGATSAIVANKTTPENVVAWSRSTTPRVVPVVPVKLPVGVAGRPAEGTFLPPPPAVAKTYGNAATAVRPASLVVPGISLGRTKLGSSVEDLTKLLGKAGQSSGDTFLYRSADRKYFLCINFTDGRMSEIAFSSPVFGLSDGTNLSNFSNALGRFGAPVEDATGKYRLYRLNGGGFTIILRKDGSVAPVGVVHACGVTPNRFDWLQLEDSTRASASSKPDEGTGSPGTPRVALPATRVAAIPKPTTIVEPGNLLGKTRIGLGKAELIKLLGKPSEDAEDVATYWSRDKRLFIIIRFDTGNKVSDIAFCSSAFGTEDGLTVATFHSRLSEFGPPERVNGWQVYTLKSGGLSFAVKDGKTVGWLHRADDAPMTVFWKR